VEQGVRYDGETFVEGLPKSSLRDYSHKLIFVPAGRDFFGWQGPRLLTRGINIYTTVRRSLPIPISGSLRPISNLDCFSMTAACGRLSLSLSV
jgi:AraC family transcriptional regulator